MTIGGAFTLSLVKDPACLGKCPPNTTNCSIEKCFLRMPCPNSTPGKCLATAAIVAGGAALALYIGYKLGQRSARCNNKIQLDSKKVVDTIDIEDIGEKKAFCRCWKSEKWPYCDGAHGKHNKETGDNLGPVVVKKSEPKKE